MIEFGSHLANRTFLLHVLGIELGTVTDFETPVCSKPMVSVVFLLDVTLIRYQMSMYFDAVFLFSYGSSTTNAIKQLEVQGQYQFNSQNQ